MYTSTFIFKPGQYDDDFHRLDQRIAAIAKAIPGYLGEETWENAEGLIQNVYYWESEASMRQLIEHPTHAQAKANQSRWLDGYRVVISKVLKEYGDGKVAPSRAALQVSAHPRERDGVDGVSVDKAKSLSGTGDRT